MKISFYGTPTLSTSLSCEITNIEKAVSNMF